MVVPDYALYDEVEMKKAHPCSSRSKRFQLLRVASDVKMKCMGCGNIIVLNRDVFDLKIRKVLKKNDSPIEKISQ